MNTSGNTFRLFTDHHLLKTINPYQMPAVSNKIMITSIWLSLVITGIACHTNDPCASIYVDATDKYCVELDNPKDLINRLENGRYLFSHGKDSVYEDGVYKDGFRDGTWNYYNQGNVKEIQWTHYTDKDLHFETNLFPHFGPILNGGHCKDFTFTTPLGKLELNISINPPDKDSMKMDRFTQFTRKAFQTPKAEITKLQQYRLPTAGGSVFLLELAVESDSPSIRKHYLRNALCYLNYDVVEITAYSTVEHDRYRELLFNAVVTNFYLNRQRMYFPFNNPKDTLLRYYHEEVQLPVP